MAADASDNINAGGGTEAPDERRAAGRPRPSVTIDLTAEEITPAAAKPAEGDASAGDTGHGADNDAADAGDPKPSGAPFNFGSVFAADGGLRRSLIAGVIGGVVALVVVLLLQSVGILPAPGRAAAERASQQAKAANQAAATLDQRLAKVEAATGTLSGLQQDIAALSDKVASLDALRPAIASRGDVETVSTGLAALTKRLDDAPKAATRDDLDAVAQRVGRLEAADAAGSDGQGASAAALSSLTTQLNQAQAELRALADKVATADAHPLSAGEDAVRAMAIASLRRAAAESKPFVADVDTIANLGLDNGDMAVVRTLAAKGVPTTAELTGGFPDVAEAILAASRATDANANILQRAWTNLSGLVQVRPVGPVAGDDPGAIVSRMSDDVAKGNFAAALAERRSLPQAGQDASADWAAKAGDRDVLDRAVDRIAEAATAKSG
jgi:hypothetical protein